MASQDPAHLRLKFARIRIGLTQIEMARVLEITNGALCRIEAGEYPPGADLKVRILGAAGVDWDEPVEPTSDPSEAETLDLPAASSR